jgi:hypothetical protein
LLPQPYWQTCAVRRTRVLGHRCLSLLKPTQPHAELGPGVTAG